LNQSYDNNISRSIGKINFGGNLSQNASSAYLNPSSTPGVKISKVNIKNSRQTMDIYNEHSGHFNSHHNYADQTNNQKSGNKKIKAKQQIASHKLLYMSQERPFP
jgi:hypothetical protein